MNSIKRVIYGAVLFLAVLLLPCRLSQAEETTRPIPDDLKEHLSFIEVNSLHIDGFEDALVVDGLVYQYQAETDSFTMCFIMDQRTSLIPKDYIYGRPVTAIGFYVFDDGFNSWIRELILPPTLREPLRMDEDGVKVTSIVFPEGMKNPGSMWGSRYLKRVVLP